MGDAGMGYTDYTDGTMRYIYKDLSHKYNGFPIEVYHVYKRNSGWNYWVGNDWKLNLHKEVKKKKTYIVTLTKSAKNTSLKTAAHCRKTEVVFRVP